MSNYASVCTADGGTLYTLGGVTSPAGNANGQTFTGAINPVTGQGVVVDTLFAPGTGATFSLEFFVQPPAGSTNIDCVNAGDGVMSGMAMNGVWFFWNNHLSSVGAFAMPGQPLHCVVAVGPTAADAFCNGIHVGRLSLPNGYQPGIDPVTHAPFTVQVGASGWFNGRSSSAYSGTVSEFRIYPYALTLAQAIAHFRERGTNAAPPSPAPGVSPYFDAVIADNPAFFYRFDETSGTKAFDRTGNGNDGAFVGPTDSYLLGEPGPLGNDSDLSTVWVPAATDSYGFTGVATPITNLGGSGVGFTCEAWIQAGSYPPDTALIMGGSQPAQSGGGFAFSIGTNGHLTCLLSANGFGGLVNIADPSPLTISAWHYVALTWDGSTVRLYRDGQLVSSEGASGGGTVIIPANMCIALYPLGSNGDGTGSQSYAIGQAAFYQYALSPTQIANHYARASTPPPPPPTYGIAGTDEHYYEVRIYDQHGTLLDIPHESIEAINVNDVLNGGSADGTIEFRSDFNNTPPAGFLYRVLIWVWHGRIARPLDPWWAGYMLEPDQEKLTNDGHTTWHLMGDQGLLNRGLVIEDINPGVDGNPQLDAADYLRHLTGPNGYADPSFGAFSIPTQMFPLQPMQFQQMLLGAVIDQVVKSGRSSYGVMWIWRVDVDHLLRRTFSVLPDQNPNVVPGAKFRHIVVDDECSVYKISTVYDQLINVILVTGGTDPTTGYPATGVYEDSNSIAEFGAWEQAISCIGLTSQAACLAYGQAYLDMYANPQANGTIEMHAPDPSIKSGQWVQTWEKATAGSPIIKQWRVNAMNVKITPTKVTMQLSPVAPTPYLDEAVYRVGMQVQNTVTAASARIPANTQTTFTRLGGAVTSP